MRKLQFKALMRGGVGGLCGLLLLLAAQAASAQTIEFLPGAPSVYENGGGAGTNVTIVITRTPATGASTVQFSTTNGTATSPADYTALSFPVSFIDGESFQVISIPIVDDLLPEGTEFFTATLSNPVGGTLGANSNTVVSIFDNDGTFQFIPTTNVVVAEDQTNVVILVERTGDLSGSASVSFYTADLSAQSAPPAFADYTSLSGTVIFTNGQGTNTILIPITEDCRIEGTETFQVILTNGVGATVSTLAGVTTVAITDNDTAAGTIEFGTFIVNGGPIILADPENPLVYEHLTTTITMRVTRRQACNTNNTPVAFSGAASVEVRDLNNSLISLGLLNCPGTDLARRGLDFTIPGMNGNGVLTLSLPNANPVEFTITINNDLFVELDERINLELSIPNQNPTPALGDRRAQSITIRSDDLPAGGVDPFFNNLNILNPTPGANGEVLAVAAVTDPNSANVGKSYIGGDFTAVNAIVRNGIARLDFNGLVDTTFNPGSGADGFVESIKIQGDGKVVIGGGFRSINNISRLGIARLNEDGSLDNTFNPGSGVHGVVHDMVLQPDGKIIIAGEFDAYNDVPVKNIARLSPNGALDTSFQSGEGPNGPIWSLSVAGILNRFEVSAFNSGSGPAEFRTSVPVGANSGTVTVFFDFACVPDTLHVYYGTNRIYDSGLTNNYFPSDCFDPNAVYLGFIQVDVPFAPTPSNSATNVTIVINEGSGDPGTVWDFFAFVQTLGAGQQIYVGGDFTTFNNVTRHNVARLKQEGALDLDFAPIAGPNGVVYSVAAQSDGAVLMGGSFNTVDSQSRNGIARLTTNGLLDVSFKSGSGVDGVVYDITLQSDGAPIIAGDFLAYNGTPRANIARLYTNGVLDTSFLDVHYNQTQPGFNGFLKAVALQPNLSTSNAIDNVLVGGSFSTVGGGVDIFTGMVTNAVNPRFNFARLIGGTNPESFNMPGNIEFVSAQYSIGEEVLGGVLNVTVQRVNGRYGPVSATIFSEDGTAVAGTDFQAVNTTVTFPDCFTGFTTFSIPIFNNALIQGNRTFSLVITNPESLGGVAPAYPALGAQSRAIVTVVDDDFPRGAIGFSQPVFTVGESGPEAIINVTRTNGSVGSVTVEYSTYNLTALAGPGNDYTLKAGTLTFSSGVTNQEIRVAINNDIATENEEWFGIRLTNVVGGATLSLSNATVLILDNEASSRGSISFASLNYSVNESNSTATVLLRRTSGVFGALTATIATFDFPPGAGNARSNIDYVSLVTNVTFAQGVITQAITIPIVADNFVEGDEHLSLRVLSVSGGGSLGFQTNSILTIVDDDAYGVLSFTDVNLFVNERGTNAVITVLRTRGSAEEVSVDFATTPLSAVDGVDYVGTNGTLVFPDGVRSLTITVPIINDSDLEYNEAFTIALTNFQKAGPGPFTNSTVTIIDDEALDVPAGSADPSFAANPNGAVNTLGLQSDGKLVIGGDFTTVDGFTLNHLARLTIAGTVDPLFNIGQGANDRVHAVLVQSDDKILLGGRFSTFNSTNRSGITRLNLDGSIDSSFNPGAGTDNPVFALALTAQNKIVLGGNFTTFNGITRPNVVLLNTNGSLDVAFNTGAGPNATVHAVAVQPDGKILIGGDFTAVNNTNRARIARLNANGSLDLSFNAGTGPDGSVRAVIVQPDGNILIGGFFTNINGTVQNRLARLLPNGASDPSFNAGTGADGAVFALALQPNNRILVAGDFRTFNGLSRNRITRLEPTGATDFTINFGVGANHAILDLLVQSDEQIVIGGAFTQFNGAARQYVARIVGGENAGFGTFAFLTSTFFADENGSNAVISVVRNGGTLDAVTVQYSTFDGIDFPPFIAGISPTHYLATSGTLTFAPGETLGTFTVPINGDGLAEGDKLVFISLSSPTGGADLDPLLADAALIIQEDDSAIGFLSASYAVNEGAVGGHANIEVMRTGATNTSAAVFFSTTPGSAIDGADYAATGALVLFAPGEIFKIVTVPIIEDFILEGYETIGLSLSSPMILNRPTATASLGLDTAILTITDNDLVPNDVLTFVASTYFVSEDGGSITIEVVRTNGYSGEMTVNFETLSISATADVDYRATNGTVTFLDGQTSAFITLYLIDDAIVEGAEDFTVRLFNPVGGASLGLSSTTIRIVDNDLPGEFVFASTNFFVSEAGGPATITVLRTNGNRGAVSVIAQTSGGTASPGVDFQSVAVTLNFASGQNSATFTVPIINDTAAEGTETVGLLLSGESGGASLGTPRTATLLIQDDEISVGFASATNAVSETVPSASITLVRRGNTSVGFTVFFNTSDGTATAGSDYAARSVGVSFAPGQTSAVVIVPILDDTLAEGDETVNLTLSSPSGGVSLGPIFATALTILDNETGFSFSRSTYTTNEGFLNLAITVFRIGLTNSAVTVDYATSDGTATAGFDYLQSTGQLAFAAGQTSATFNVSIFDDLIVEGDEFLNLALSNPLAPAFLGPQSTAVIVILDNDTMIGFSQTNYIVNENAGTAVITLVRSGGTALAASVTFQTQNGTAFGGSDYTPLVTTVSWAAGDSAPKTVSVTIAPDGASEGVETVNLLLSNPINAIIDPAAGSAVLSIADNAGAIAFASVSSSVVEGSGSALINLVRTGGSNGVVSVQWNVVGGTATPGQDYFDTVGFVVFADGETVKPIVFPIGDDGNPEGIETVNLALSNATGGARVGSPNTATLSIVDNENGIIVGAGSTLIAESFLPTNNIIEPGETVTLLFALRNAGSIDAANVTATLVYANGVTNSTPQTQNYGALLAGGNVVSRPFTFTALGTNGSRITATLLITNSGVFVGTVTFDFVIGVQNIPFQNAGVITIPVQGQASPYPATITVSGVSGPVEGLTVTLHNMTHPTPQDLDILLVAPNGAAVMLMSDAGTNIAINGVTITFDDNATRVIPQFGTISNGTYRCANYGVIADTLSPPFAPGTPWNNTSLASLNGINPNGVWSLYVFDDTPGNAGAINGGWSLRLATSDPVIPGADLGVTVNDAPDPVTFGGTFTYTATVANYGPAAASAVTLTNLLPGNANFISVSGPGSYTINGNTLIGSLGNIPAGGSAVVTITMSAPNASVTLNYGAMVSAGTADLNSINNQIGVQTTVVSSSPLPMPLLSAAIKNNKIVLSWPGTASNIVLECAPAIKSAPWTNMPVPVISNGMSTVTAPIDASAKFFRLKRTP